MMRITSLEPDDRRAFDTKVAGPAALTVAKLHKLGERQDSPGRLLDKDAHGLYRLLRAVETQEIADGFSRLRGDARSREVAREALDYLAALFKTNEALGAVMAGRAEQGVPDGDPSTVAASVVALSDDLLTAVVSLRGA